jgi:hypothetical protein
MSARIVVEMIGGPFDGERFEHDARFARIGARIRIRSGRACEVYRVTRAEGSAGDAVLDEPVPGQRTIV